MKSVDVELWELTKEEVRQLPEGTQVLIYNPLTGRKSLDDAGKKCIANSKYASDKLVYLVFEKPGAKNETD